MASVSRSALREALSAVDFPVAKDDLVVHAEQAGAPEDVQRALRSLPPVDYRNADEVLSSVQPDLTTEPAARPDLPGGTPPT